MEHKESLRVLGLTEQSTLQDLTSVFRKLVKKYHPDLNRDKEEWSNRQMRFLNEAYASAYKYLSSERRDNESAPPQPEEAYARRYKTYIHFEKAMDASLAYLHSALEVYYQYGLDNIVLRQEGTRRSRFNSSVRKAKKSFSLLKPLAEQPLTVREEDILEAVVHFIRFFYKSMHIRSIRPSDGSPYERKAFRHYFHGSALVDNVIKEVMFREFVESFKLGRLTENIKLAEAEFNTVIIDYPDALCLRETEIKKELLYAFMDLTDFNDQGLISLY